MPELTPNGVRAPQPISFPPLNVLWKWLAFYTLILSRCLMAFVSGYVFKQLFSQLLRHHNTLAYIFSTFNPSHLQIFKKKHHYHLIILVH